jgi:hypothetical protein
MAGSVSSLSTGSDEMITYFNRHRFLGGFNELPPWFWQPNMTDVYHPPIVYMIAALYGFKNILEIGVAEGYGAWYLANAAKENGGHYLGIDIIPVWDRVLEPWDIKMTRYFEGEQLPCRWIESDTKKMTEIPSFADGGLDVIDIAYIDGEHQTDTIMHEVNDLIVPKMKGDGWSYLCLDDVVDQGAQGAWAILKKDPRFEACGFHPNGGFGILRYMEGGRS